MRNTFFVLFLVNEGWGCVSQFPLVQPHWSHLMFSNTNGLKMFLGVNCTSELLQETHVEHLYCWGSISFYEISSIASYPATLLAPPYNYHTFVSDLTLNRCWCSYIMGKVCLNHILFLDQLRFFVIPDQRWCQRCRQNVTFPIWTSSHFCKWRLCAHATGAKIESCDQVQFSKKSAQKRDLKQQKSNGPLFAADMHAQEKCIAHCAFTRKVKGESLSEIKYRFYWFDYITI